MATNTVNRLIYPTLTRPVDLNVPVSVNEAMWHQPYANPDLGVGLRRANAIAQMASGAVRTEPIDNPPPPGDNEAQRHNPFSLPDLWVKVRKAAAITLATASGQTRTDLIDAVMESKFHQPYSDPDLNVLQRAGRAIALAASSGQTRTDLVDNTEFESKWHQPFSDPDLNVKVRAGRAIAQMYEPGTWPAHPERNPYTWFRPLSEPYLEKKLQTRLQPFSPNVPVPRYTGAPMDWYRPLSERLFGRPMPVQLQSTTTIGRPPTTMEWWQPFSERLHSRPFQTKLQMAMTVPTPAAPFGEIILESEWHQPFSEPQWQKKGLRAAYHPPFSSWTPWPRQIARAYIVI